MLDLERKRIFVKREAKRCLVKRKEQRHTILALRHRREGFSFFEEKKALWEKAGTKSQGRMVPTMSPTI